MRIAQGIPTVRPSRARRRSIVRTNKNINVYSDEKGQNPLLGANDQGNEKRIELEGDKPKAVWVEWHRDAKVARKFQELRSPSPRR